MSGGPCWGASAAPSAFCHYRLTTGRDCGLLDLVVRAKLIALLGALADDPPRSRWEAGSEAPLKSPAVQAFRAHCSRGDQEGGPKVHHR